VTSNSWKEDGAEGSVLHRRWSSWPETFIRNTWNIVETIRDLSTPPGSESCFDTAKHHFGRFL